MVVVGRKVLQAAPPSASCRTADQVISQTPELSQLAGLLGSLSGPLRSELSTRAGNAFTFFAPSNGALASLLKMLPDARAGGAPELVRNSTALTALLSYHLVPGEALTAAQLGDGAMLRTALGGTAPLRVRRADGSVVIVGVGSEAVVTQPDLRTCKGVIHIVDTVLLPVDSFGRAGGAATPGASSSSSRG